MTTQAKKQTAEKPQGTNSLAIAGFVLSICGFFTGITFIIGLILSAVGLSQTKKTGQDGRGLAIAGTVIGTVGTVFSILFTIIISIAFFLFVTNIGGVVEPIMDDCSFDYSYDEITQEYSHQFICD